MLTCSRVTVLSGLLCPMRHRGTAGRQSQQGRILPEVSLGRGGLVEREWWLRWWRAGPSSRGGRPPSTWKLAHSSACTHINIDTEKQKPCEFTACTMSRLARSCG